MFILEQLLGSYSKKQIKRYQTILKKINQLESTYQSFSRQDCLEKTEEFRRILKAKEQSLDDLLPSAFALVRKVAFDTIGERHFDVQILGGIALHYGTIAEMKTGEGKTLTSTLATYLNALEGKGVHLVTVNEYLAKRDSEWMGQIFEYFGFECRLYL